MFLRIFIALAAILFLADAGKSAEGEECPRLWVAGKGYVLERDNNSQYEVFHDGANVRTILRQRGQVLLETTQYEGLFDLDRLDRGRRTTLKPQSNLAKFFPLRAKQQIVAEFEVVAAGTSPIKRTVALKVIGDDEFYIGKCKYKVLKIEHRQSQGDNAAPVFYDFEYYAPELKLVIAKEFKERDGRTTINKYDKIYLRGD